MTSDLLVVQHVSVTAIVAQNCIAVVIWCASLGNIYLCRSPLQGNI